MRLRRGRINPQLFLGSDAFAGHLLAGTAFDQHKYFPTEVAQWLEDWANTAASNLAKAKQLTPKPTDATFRRLEADVAIPAISGKSVSIFGREDPGPRVGPYFQWP